MKSGHKHNIPNDDKKHYLHCPECGEYFDMRNLASVLEHQHFSMPLPNIHYAHARQVLVPRQFPRQSGNPN
jgi:phage terminase large subunit GpA-like protein